MRAASKKFIWKIIIILLRFNTNTPTWPSLTDFHMVSILFCMNTISQLHIVWKCILCQTLLEVNFALAPHPIEAHAAPTPPLGQVLHKLVHQVLDNKRFRKLTVFLKKLYHCTDNYICSFPKMSTHRLVKMPAPIIPLLPSLAPHTIERSALLQQGGKNLGIRGEKGENFIGAGIILAK